MCFLNNGEVLRKLRAQKQPIEAWKEGVAIDPPTGMIRTSYYAEGKSRVVIWEQGTVVRPHKILRMRKDKEPCSAGLYFYVGSKVRNPHSRTLIDAIVNPRDIIGATYDGGTICVTRARVIKAPNPDRRAYRIKYLTEEIKFAHIKKRNLDKRMQQLIEEQPDREEALLLMMDELKTLRATKISG